MNQNSGGICFADLSSGTYPDLLDVGYHSAFCIIKIYSHALVECVADALDFLGTEQLFLVLLLRWRKIPAAVFDYVIVVIGMSLPETPGGTRLTERKRNANSRVDFRHSLNAALISASVMVAQWRDTPSLSL